MIGRLAKLRGRSSGELLVRGAQEISTLLERYGVLSDARTPTDAALRRALDPDQALEPEALLARFRQRGGTGFFSGFADPDATEHLVRTQHAEAADAIIARATRACAGRFDLFGRVGLSYGDPIDWHADPITGRRAPLVHWSRVPYLDAAVVGDHKVIWELNRHQHFVTLGQAYWLTGDERFARTFASQLESWLDANPPKLGINWTSSLEVALRAISWCWALQYFKTSDTLSPSLFVRALKSLYLHARHVERYLSTYFAPNTHLTGEALGLFYLGSVFPEFRRAAQWRDLGWRILEAELERQVRPDGVYFEQATWYQRYTADFYVHALLLARANGRAVPERMRARVEMVLDHLMHLTRPDGRTPLFGDDDGGRLVPLGDAAPNDFRATLAAGALLFARPDWCHVAEPASAELAWLAGSDAVTRRAEVGTRVPAELSRAFPDGGFVLARDGWTDESNYIAMDCGPHGALIGAHAHADALSIEVTAFGRPILVDAGTFSYIGPERNHFRSSLSHNTLSLDQASSALPGEPFRWRHTADGTIRAWVSQPAFDYLEASHDGYRRLDAPARHARSLLFLRGRYWILRDRVESAGEHGVEARFHCAPGVSASLEGASTVTLIARDERGHAGLRMATFGEHGSYTIEPGWVSPQYGAREAVPVCRFQQHGRGTQEIVTLLLPWRGRKPDGHVVETAVQGGRSYLIVRESGTDLMVIGSGGGGGAPLAAAGVETDAEWAWIGREPGGHRTVEFVLVRGSMLRVDGHDLFRTSSRAAWISGRRVNGAWSIATGELEPPRRG